MASLALKAHAYKTPALLLVIEGLYVDHEYPSLVGYYGSVPDGLLPSGLVRMIEPPSSITSGFDPASGSIDLSSITATFPATDSLLSRLYSARSGDYSQSFVWMVPSVHEQAGFPGRYINQILGTSDLPPHLTFHSSTAQYQVDNIIWGTGYQIRSSAPLPPAGTEVACWAGQLPMAGRRMAIIRIEPDTSLRTIWQGFVEGWSLSGQQTEIEIRAVEALRPLDGTLIDPPTGSLDVSRQLGSYWRGTARTTTPDTLPVAQTPLEVGLRDGGGSVILPRGRYDLEASHPTFSGETSFVAPTSEDSVTDPVAQVVYGYDPAGLLGRAMGAALAPLTPIDVVLRWLDFHLLSGQVQGDVTVYSGEVWQEIMDVAEWQQLSPYAPAINHALLDRDTRFSDLLKILGSLGFYPRLTSEGKLGLTRLRSFNPLEDFAALYSEDPDVPSARVILTPDRIDVDHDLRKSEATFVGNLGGVVDGVDPDRITVRPARAVQDPAPRYMGSEVSFDFPWYSRGTRGRSVALDALRDRFDLLRSSPVLHAVVPLESFVPWDSARSGSSDGHSRLPAVGDWVRLDRGPKTGIVIGGQRVLLEDLDLGAVGMLIHTTIDLSTRTAEISVLMPHSTDAMPRLIAPNARVLSVLDSKTLSVDFYDGETFRKGDQVRLADLSGRFISSEIYTVDGATGSSLLISNISVQDQAKIADLNAGDPSLGRGVILRLATLDEYSNEGWSTSPDYITDPDKRERIWAYWDADDYWTLT